MELTQAKLTFITESSELLVEMENALLILEKSSDDQDTINSLFRSAHTIKGASGILGIDHVEKFTHVVENLLSKVREGEIGITNEAIELLLECRDHIKALIELAASDAPLTATVMAKDAELLVRLTQILGTKEEKPRKEAKGADAPAAAITGTLAQTDAWHISLRFGPDVLRGGMDPIPFINYLSKLGEVTSLTTIFDSIPPLEAADPESCYLGFEVDFKSDFDKKAIEDVFEFVREDCKIHILPPHSRIESYVELINGLPEDTLLLGEILVNGGALTQPELEEALKLQGRPDAGAEEGKRLLGEILVSEHMVQQDILDAALLKQKKTQEVKSKEAKTIRIDADKLDSLINLVGELVISSANIDQQAQRIKDTWLLESASSMLCLVEEIRDTSMKIRMVPIGETFSRFNRVIRDISKETGKEIELEIKGGETELDKTVVEKISDPLMHLVRNAADHGIETSEQRVSAGKPSKGTIRLNAYHDAGSIVIEIIDDGRGLNRKKILDKAIALGLANTAQSLTDNEIFRFIFEPGFSTAEAVTKLSGRGVGMDVVKRNIESLRGTVDVESAEGAGAKVVIRLPLTLAIIDGFMVGVQGSSYVIPLDMVVECVELSDAERQAASRRSYINLRGEVLPYVRLRDFFRLAGESPRFENIVVVQYASVKIGLVVDELYGEVQTVIKSLGRVYRDIQGISGATIMGNGKVALILDIPRLIACVEHEASRAS
ncbi:MAG: chemotaxis protein CheA [Deltaproteobacteria bacterium]|nr:chemotaxis protein CheA [Deltaproteobacteria bacterium]